MALLSLVVPGLLSKCIEESFLSFTLSSLVAVFCTIIVEFYVGCNGKERAFVIEKMNIVKNKILKNDKDQ